MFARLEPPVPGLDGLLHLARRRSRGDAAGRDRRDAHHDAEAELGAGGDARHGDPARRRARPLASAGPQPHRRRSRRPCATARAAARSVAEEDADPAAADAHGSGRAPTSSWPSAQKAHESAKMSVESLQGAAEGEDRDDASARSRNARRRRCMKPGRRRDRRAAVVRRGRDRRQVPRADQAGSRRIEGGRRSRHRLASTRKAIERERTSRRLKAAGILQQFEVEMGLEQAGGRGRIDGRAERRRPRRREAGTLKSVRWHLLTDDELEPARFCEELIVNQYQAIVLGGTALASLVSAQSAAAARLARRRAGAAAAARLGAAAPPASHRRRMRARPRRRPTRRAPGSLPSLGPANREALSRRWSTCAGMIEANYQGLHGISQAYLSEQRGKLDMILDGCAAPHDGARSATSACSSRPQRGRCRARDRRPRARTDRRPSCRSVRGGASRRTSS